MELKYLMETISFVERGIMYYQCILCFHFICLYSGSINSKLKYYDNDFYYFLYTFLVFHCEKAEIFQFSVQILWKVTLCKVLNVSILNFNFNLIKLKNMLFPWRKREEEEIQGHTSWLCTRTSEEKWAISRNIFYCCL